MTDIEQEIASLSFSKRDCNAKTSAAAAQTAGYIEELTAELEKLAAGPDLEKLRDLLRLAKREARRVLMERAG